MTIIEKINNLPKSTKIIIVVTCVCVIITVVLLCVFLIKKPKKSTCNIILQKFEAVEKDANMKTNFEILNQRIENACKGNTKLDKLIIKNLTENVINVTDDKANLYIHMMLNLFGHLHDMKLNNPTEHNRIKNILENNDKSEHPAVYKKIFEDAIQKENYGFNSRENFDICKWFREHPAGEVTAQVIASAICCTVLIGGLMLVGIEVAAAAGDLCMTAAGVAFDYMISKC